MPRSAPASDPMRHSLLRMGNLLMVQERDRHLVHVLGSHGYESLEGVRAFEAGCAGGYNLRNLVQMGARVEHLAGMDISPERVAEARDHTPGLRVVAGSADAIGEPDGSFDLCLAFTLFSSVRDEEVAHGIARELVRITKAGGLILIYDMRRRSPRNPNVHPIGIDDLRRWFPRCPVRARSITLAPPIARLAGRFAPWLYGPLAAIPPLRSHTFYVLRRPALPPTL